MPVLLLLLVFLNDLLIKKTVVISKFVGISLLTLLIYTSLINGRLKFDYLSNFAIALVVVSNIRNTRRYHLVEICFMGSVMLSLFVALGQAAEIDAFWDLRRYLPKIQDDMVARQIAAREKPPGLAYYSIQLGFQMSALALLLARKRYAMYYLTAGVVIAFFIDSMSTAVVFLGGILAIIGVYSFPLIILGVMFFGQSILEIFSSPTKLSRLTFVTIGLIMFYRNPFGYSDSSLLQEKLDIIRGFQGGYLLETLAESSFHNSILNVGLSSGLIGVVIYILLYISIMKRAYGKSYHLLQTLVLFYPIQFITHNSGPLSGDIYFWIAIGLLQVHTDRNENTYRSAYSIVN